VFVCVKIMAQIYNMLSQNANYFLKIIRQKMKG